MEWLNENPPKGINISFHQSSLTSNGIKTMQTTSQFTKVEHNVYIKHSLGYTAREQRKILAYFSTLAETKTYIQQVIESAGERYVIFTKHPLIDKFNRKVEERFDSSWRYNMKIIKRDKRFVLLMKELLKTIVENPSQHFEFDNLQAKVVNDWKRALKIVEGSIATVSRKHRTQLQNQFVKLMWSS